MENIAAALSVSLSLVISLQSNVDRGVSEQGDLTMNRGVNILHSK